MRPRPAEQGPETQRSGSLAKILPLELSGVARSGDSGRSRESGIIRAGGSDPLNHRVATGD
jgi:hypothetical protein